MKGPGDDLAFPEVWSTCSFDLLFMETKQKKGEKKKTSAVLLHAPPVKIAMTLGGI